MLGITMAIAVNAANYFVDTTLKSGNNNGSSWTDAFQTWSAYLASVQALPTITFTHTTTGSTSSSAFFASGINTITIINVNANIVVGDIVSGTGIASGTTVTAINNVNITLSQNTTLATKTINNIYVKGSIPLQSVSWNVNDNYYGSFDPASSNTDPLFRPLKDNDGNGIIDPWEFEFPTLYSSNYATVTATAVTLSNSTTLDGFTITHTASRTNGTGATLINPFGGTVKNCIITGCNLTYPGMIAKSNTNGCLIRTMGVFKNNLIEKNTVSITNIASSATASENDLKIYPILDVNLSSMATTATISGCVFRNNKATIDYSTSSATTANNLRGMVLNITDAGASNTAGTKSTVTISDCLVYNNEILFTGNATVTVTPNACIASHIIFSGSNTTNKWISNTFANNKSTNLKNTCMTLSIGGNSPDFAINSVYNNVFWNNQNTISSTGTTTKATMASGSAQNVGSVIANNVMDGATTGNWSSIATYFADNNNKTDLSSTNTTATKGPQFKSPNLVIGVNRIAGSQDSIDIAHSDWRLNAGSYLIAKGAPVTTTGIDTDKAGISFATTTNPAVGAYEYVADVPTEISVYEEFSSFNVRFNKLQVTEAGTLKIYSLSGKLIEDKNVSEGQEITLLKGVYVIRFTTPTEIRSQKVVI